MPESNKHPNDPLDKSIFVCVQTICFIHFVADHFQIFLCLWNLKGPRSSLSFGGFWRPAPLAPVWLCQVIHSPSCQDAGSRASTENEDQIDWAVYCSYCHQYDEHISHMYTFNWIQHFPSVSFTTLTTFFCNIALSLPQWKAVARAMWFMPHIFAWCTRQKIMCMQESSSFNGFLASTYYYIVQKQVTKSDTSGRYLRTPCCLCVAEHFLSFHYSQFLICFVQNHQWITLLLVGQFYFNSISRKWLGSLRFWGVLSGFSQEVFEYLDFHDASSQCT